MNLSFLKAHYSTKNKTKKRQKSKMTDDELVNNLGKLHSLSPRHFLVFLA